MKTKNRAAEVVGGERKGERIERGKEKELREGKEKDTKKKMRENAGEKKDRNKKKNK